MLEVVTTWPAPAQLKHAGKGGLDAKLKRHEARRHTAWAGIITEALAAQIVTAVGADAAGLVIRHLAKQLISLYALRVDLAIHLEKMVEDHPLCPAPTSMSGGRRQDSSDHDR